MTPVRGQEDRNLKSGFGSLEMRTPLPRSSFPFFGKARKITKKQRLVYSGQTSKILGKEGKNAQKQGNP